MISGFDQTTLDAFLGGKLILEQPYKGYRAGIDPVMLAASIPAISGQSVLDIGCGVGAALYCLGRRVKNLQLAGIEIQPAYLDLCRKNGARNNLKAKLWLGNAMDPPAELRSQSFDHVISNPPYFDRDRGSTSPLAHRDMAFGESISLQSWIDAATRRLKPKGRLTLIQKADRLADLLGAIDGRLGSILLWPIAGREGRAADRILIQAKKGGKSPLRLLAPIILHDGPQHEIDKESYRPEIQNVLRSGSALPFPV